MTIELDGFVRKRTKIKLGTKEFTFSELSIADLAEFRAHLQSEREAQNKKRRQQLIDTATQIGSINPMELLKYVDNPLTDEEFEDEMDSTGGIIFMAYLSLRYHHEGIDKNQVATILTPSVIDDVTKAMLPMSVVDGDDDKKKAAQATKPKQLNGQQQ